MVPEVMSNLLRGQLQSTVAATQTEQGSSGCRDLSASALSATFTLSMGSNPVCMLNWPCGIVERYLDQKVQALSSVQIPALILKG